MSNRKRRMPGPAQAPATDLGPIELRLAGRVEVLEVADPDNARRTVRRAHTRHHVTTLLRRGGLELRECLACLRWSELLELEAGASDRPGLLGASARVEPWMRGHPGAVQVQAAALLREARGILGKLSAEIMDAFAGEGLTAREIAVRLGMDDRVCMGLVRGALLRLAELWRL
jgi:hypothetical protein